MSHMIEQEFLHAPWQLGVEGGRSHALALKIGKKKPEANSL